MTLKIVENWCKDVELSVALAGRPFTRKKFHARLKPLFVNREAILYSQEKRHIVSITTLFIICFQLLAYANFSSLIKLVGHSSIIKILLQK